MSLILNAHIANRAQLSLITLPQGDNWDSNGTHVCAQLDKALTCVFTTGQCTAHGSQFNI